MNVHTGLIRWASRAGVGLVLAALLALTGCGGGASGTVGSTTVSVGVNPVTTTNPDGSTLTIPLGNLALTEVATGLGNPWSLAFLPDGRMLITERPGRLRLMAADGSGSAFVTGLPAVDAAGQGGLLDVVVDPAFASNRRVYFSFSERDAANAALNGTAVARAELDVATRTLGNLTVIYRQSPKVASTGHYGSRLVFDTAGHLFVTMGDRQLDTQRGFAQDVARGNGKVARITTDGAPAPGNPPWSTPGAQAALWSYGHRNPQGAALNPATGELWTNEHGPQGGDEVNRTLAGRNYGWPVISYGQEYGTTTPVGVGTAQAGMEQPVSYWETINGSAWTGGAKSSMAPSGMAFYTGDRIPEWRGSLFVGALAGTSLWRLTLSGNTVTARERLLADRGERIRDVRQGPDGALWLLTDDAANGKLLRIAR